MIRLDGRNWPSVNVTSGVRQGCPISPLFFLLAVEPLLRKLQQLNPNNKYKAYADDIGAVVHDLLRDIHNIIATFDTFQKVSGLHIHTNKTVVIPTCGNTRINDAILSHYKSIPQNSSWPDVTVAKEGKYLGFLLGMNVDRTEEYNIIVKKY